MSWFWSSFLELTAGIFELGGVGVEVGVGVRVRVRVRVGVRVRVRVGVRPSAREARRTSHRMRPAHTLAVLRRTKARSGAVRDARCSGESEIAASMAAPTLVRGYG